MKSTDSLKELESALLEHNFDPNDIRLDTGKIHRFKRLGKKNKNGWLIGWTHALKKREDLYLL